MNLLRKPLATLARSFSSPSRDARPSWASARDLALMIERRHLVVLDDATSGKPVGRWTGDGPHRGRVLGVPHGLSVLNVSPTGTGKTSGFVAPTVVGVADDSSLVVHDPKGEVWDACAPRLAGRTNVFVLDWSALDDVPCRSLHDSHGRPLFDGDGRRAFEADYGAARFHARFNFLSPRFVPERGQARDFYVERMALILIPERRGGGDSYFVDKGRAAMAGLLHAFIAVFGDAGDRDGVPAAWRGMEPSIPMMVDWLATPWFVAESADGRGPAVDPVGEWLAALVARVSPVGREGARGTSDRAFKELASLVHMTDKERSGILGTVDQALLPFKNEAVRQRTSACDFVPEDLRGMVDPDDGIARPVAVFVTGKLAEAPAFATITALLFEVLGTFCTSYGPGAFVERSERCMGPHPVTFVVDEFAGLPQMPSAMTGPDLGRSKALSYQLVARDFAEIERVYGRDGARVIMGTTFVKVVRPGGDRDAMSRVVSMVRGTVGEPPPSAGSGVAADAGFPFHRDLAAMPPGRHAVLLQGFMHKPLDLEAVAAVPLASANVDVWSGVVRGARRDVMPAWVREARVVGHREGSDAVP